MNPKSTRLAEHVCPWCSSELSAAWSPLGHLPEPGDWTICIFCGGWLVFTRNMRARKPRLRERADIARSSEASALHSLWEQFKRERKQ